MLDILFAIIPVFALILLGFALMRFSIPSLDFWHLNNKLVYWVLIPSLLFNKTSQIAISADLVGKYAIAIYAGFFSVVILSVVFSKILRFSSPTLTSVMQGSARHNTFIVLAVAETIYGSTGLSTAALGSALLIPMTNLTVVTLMVFHLSKGQRIDALLLNTLGELARNPLIIAVLMGLTFNYFDWEDVPILHETTRLLGGAALPIVLLGVGANIQVKGFVADWTPLILSCLLKMVVFTLVIFFVCLNLGLTETQTAIALLFGAVPTAAPAYTLAKQMGGDAPLMAAIVVVQTGISILTIPLIITLYRYFTYSV